MTGTWAENKHLYTSDEWARLVRQEEALQYEHVRRQLKPTAEERAADEAARAAEAARRQALENFNSFIKGEPTMTTNLSDDRQQEIFNKHMEALKAELALEDAKSQAQKNYEAAERVLLQYGEEYTTLFRNASQNKDRLAELKNLMEQQQKIQADSRREMDLAAQAEQERAGAADDAKYANTSLSVERSPQGTPVVSKWAGIR